MNKTQELIAAIKSGAYRIDSQGFVYRRLTKDHIFSGARAGEWAPSYMWRRDVIARAARVIETSLLNSLQDTTS